MGRGVSIGGRRLCCMGRGLELWERVGLERGEGLERSDLLALAPRSDSIDHTSFTCTVAKAPHRTSLLRTNYLLPAETYAHQSENLPAVTPNVMAFV